MLDYPLVELKTTRLEAIPRTRMAAIEDRHIVFLSHLVDSGEEGRKVLLSVDILLSMSAEEYVFAFLQAETGMNVARLDFAEILI